MVAINNHIKAIKNKINGGKLDLPQNEKLVVTFFIERKLPFGEAKKFHCHYQSIRWKVGGTAEIVDWFALAKKWMLKAKELKEDKTLVPVSQNTDNLGISSMKDLINRYEPTYSLCGL